MVISSIKETLDCDILKVWEIIFDVSQYSKWRSDLSETKFVNDKQFIEYIKNDYATIFTITVIEPYQRWEFDLENNNMKGHWVGVFTSKNNQTKIDFTENIAPKKRFMKPFVKSY